MFFFKKKKKNLIGLDLGAGLVKFAKLEGTIDEPVLANYGIKAMISDDVIVDGEIMDRTSVIDTITQLLEDREETVRNVAIGVSGRSVIVKHIDIDEVVTPENEKETLDYYVNNSLMVDVSEVQIDSSILKVDESAGKSEALLVAVKDDHLNSLLGIYEEVGLNVEIVDVIMLAVQNIAEFTGYIKPGELVTLLHIGSQSATMAYVSESNHHFSKDFPNISIEGLNNLLQKNGLPLTRDDLNKIIAGEIIEYDKDAFNNILNLYYEEVTIALERVEPFIPHEEFGGVSRIVLSGGGALIPGLKEALNDKFGVDVEILNPFTKISPPSEMFAGKDPERLGPVLAPAIGLALRSLI